MVHIKITKGLDIPIAGKPAGSPQPLTHSGGDIHANKWPKVALDLSGFDDVKFKVLVRVDDQVKLGQPLAEDKNTPGRFFVSPAGGIVREIRRGLKRKLLDIVIEIVDKEEEWEHPLINPETSTRETLVDALKTAGIFAFIKQRPFSVLADPSKIPRSIFVKGLESAPFVPPAEMQVEGYQKEFQLGLNALARLTSGDVHLVYSANTDSKAFLEAKNVVRHTAEGPHPVANHSVHIQSIDPIRSPEDVVWTLDTLTVVKIGYLLLTGRYWTKKVMSIAGPGIVEGKTGFFKVREGIAVSEIISGRVKNGFMRLISGDPLQGKAVEADDFLGFQDTVFTVIPENTEREFLHFFRLGKDKYTFSRAYLSGHLSHKDREYTFTTNQHGEHRPFIDNSLYDKVMPLAISTMHLVKAVMAEDYDLAESLGLLEVDGEDFALPTFVDQSKIDMPDIIRRGIKRYAADVG